MRHAPSRGDHLGVLFRDGKEPELFLAVLAQACAQSNWQIHAFRLLRKLTSGRR
jgi:hypothetical protein